MVCKSLCENRMGLSNYITFNTLREWQNGLHLGNDMFQMHFFSMKLFNPMKITLSVKLKLSWWLGAEQATSHCLDPCWPSSMALKPKIRSTNETHRSYFVVYCYGLAQVVFNPYMPGLLNRLWQAYEVAPIPVKQPWSMGVNTPCPSYRTDNITTHYESTYTDHQGVWNYRSI